MKTFVRILSKEESKQINKKENDYLTWIYCSVRIIGYEGVIEAVINAINTHISNADVCDYGCYAHKQR